MKTVREKKEKRESEREREREKERERESARVPPSDGWVNWMVPPVAPHVPR